MVDIDPEDRDELAKQNCPYCRVGKPLRILEHTGEFVHDVTNGSAIGVAICHSNGIRGGPHLTKV